MLSETTRQFPTHFPQDYATVLMPANNGWVNTLPLKGKKQLASLLVERALCIQKRKPNSNIKIVVMFHIRNFWRSQITVFKDATVIHNFFERNHDWQTWSKTKAEPFVEVLNIAVPKNFEVIAFIETISDEELYEVNELLFVREFERMVSYGNILVNTNGEEMAGSAKTRLFDRERRLYLGGIC